MKIRNYKLAQKYPGSPSIGTVIYETLDHYRTIERLDKYIITKREVERNTKFWKIQPDMYVILRNRAMCAKCSEIIESKHVHDYQTCKCKLISVDGGLEYLKRGFKEPTDYVEISEMNMLYYKLFAIEVNELIKSLSDLENISLRNPIFPSTYQWISWMERKFIR